MFNEVAGTQQAMLYLALILVAGFTVFTLFAIVPLIRAMICLTRTYQHMIDRDYIKNTESQQVITIKDDKNAVKVDCTTQ